MIFYGMGGGSAVRSSDGDESRPLDNLEYSESVSRPLNYPVHSVRVVWHDSWWIE